MAAHSRARTSCFTLRMTACSRLQHSKTFCCRVRRQLARSIATFFGCRCSHPPATILNSAQSRDFSNHVRLDVATYRRQARNAADDDQLLNTGVSYPIAFDKSVTYGAEGKLQINSLGPVNGFVSYSYMVAMEWFPVTGGLFLGEDAQNAASHLSWSLPGDAGSAKHSGHSME